MTDKTTEALKLAEEVIHSARCGLPPTSIPYAKAQVAIREALAEQSMAMILNDPHPPHRLCECTACLEYWTPLPDCDAFAASGKPMAEPDMNLNCPSVQARLATIWGYVKAEQEKQEPVAYCCGFENTHPDGWIDCKIFRDGEFTTPLYAAPVSAKREWVELEPWQLCEIEERIGLPIDSHDFETIGNAYIAAFKEKNT